MADSMTLGERSHCLSCYFDLETTQKPPAVMDLPQNMNFPQLSDVAADSRKGIDGHSTATEWKEKLALPNQGARRERPNLIKSKRSTKSPSSSSRSLKTSSRSLTSNSHQTTTSGKRRPSSKRSKSPYNRANVWSRMTDEEQAVFFALRKKWDTSDKVQCKNVLDDSLLLRYARVHQFDFKATWKAVKQLRKETVQHMLQLSAVSMEEQLRSRTLFPVPNLVTRDGHEVFYMKPARYCPKQTPVQDVIENLAYVMNTMYQSEGNLQNGIAFVANMDDWTFEHFSTEYCKRFMMMLQGNVIPVRVTLFLIVNPPKWFDKVWKIMKPMLTTEFQNKVRMVPETDLFEYLPFGYEGQLPDDLESGTRPTDDIVRDFVESQLRADRERSEKLHNSTCSTDVDNESRPAVPTCLDSCTEEPTSSNGKLRRRKLWKGKTRDERDVES